MNQKKSSKPKKFQTIDIIMGIIITLTVIMFFFGVFVDPTGLMDWSSTTPTQQAP